MDGLKEATEMLTFPLIAGIVTWFVTLVLGIIFMVKFKPNHKNPKIEEAIRRGHVVKGYSTGKWDGHNNRLRDKKDDTYRCDYIYKVDGKEMMYRYVGHTLPPSPISLYYLDDPRKAFPGMEMSTWGRDIASIRYALVFILPFIFGALVMNALGGL